MKTLINNISVVLLSSLILINCNATFYKTNDIEENNTGSWSADTNMPSPLDFMPDSITTSDKSDYRTTILTKPIRYTLVNGERVLIKKGSKITYNQHGRLIEKIVLKNPTKLTLPNNDTALCDSLVLDNAGNISTVFLSSPTRITIKSGDKLGVSGQIVFNDSGHVIAFGGKRIINQLTFINGVKLLINRGKPYNFGYLEINIVYPDGRVITNLNRDEKYKRYTGGEINFSLDDDGDLNRVAIKTHYDLFTNIVLPTGDTIAARKIYFNKYADVIKVDPRYSSGLNFNVTLSNKQIVKSVRAVEFYDNLTIKRLEIKSRSNQYITGSNNDSLHIKNAFFLEFNEQGMLIGQYELRAGSKINLPFIHEIITLSDHGVIVYDEHGVISLLGFFQEQFLSLEMKDRVLPNVIGIRYDEDRILIYLSPYILDLGEKEVEVNTLVYNSDGKLLYYELVESNYEGEFEKYNDSYRK